MFHRLMVSCTLLLLSTAAVAQSLPTPESAPVALYGSALRDAESKLFGRGVVLDTKARGAKAAVVATGCGTAPAEVIWREVRRRTDPEGGTHVIYRQYLVGDGLNAELHGSEIGVHRLPNGNLIGVGGRQFESVTVNSCPALSAAQAIEQAHERVLLYKGEYGRVREPWTMNAKRAERLASTQLKLVQSDGTFRPAYFTVADDVEGEPHAVVLDAEDQRLLAIREANPHSNCAPTEPQSFVTAYGIPVRSEITNWRTMKANVASRSGIEGFTHEGVWIPSDVPLVRHIGYHGTDSGSPYNCSYTSYTVYPLKVNTALNCCSPIYDDWSWTPGHTPLWGRAVGDALWNTYKTMVSFKALGWNGWNNQNADAKIVVNSGGAEFGQFVEYATGNAPSGSVRIGPPSRMYNLASSLDLVAHEWGHGVIISGPDFDYLDPVGAQMHEGWADVIGMLVEKRAQVSGTGLEQDSDWKMHEDSADSGYARGAVDDEADGITGHTWVGPNTVDDTNSVTFNDRLHRDDPNYDTGHVHSTGNMLSVAHFIMAAGGSTDLPSGLNPICARLGTLSGCESTNAITFNERLGPAKAGALLFHAITNTVLSSTTWTDVADRVNEAAFTKYNQCQFGPQHNAAGEQNAVKKAFAGIGYPRTQADIQCP